MAILAVLYSVWQTDDLIDMYYLTDILVHECVTAYCVTDRPIAYFLFHCALGVVPFPRFLCILACFLCLARPCCAISFCFHINDPFDFAVGFPLFWGQDSFVLTFGRTIGSQAWNQVRSLPAIVLLIMFLCLPSCSAGFAYVVGQQDGVPLNDWPGVFSSWGFCCRFLRSQVLQNVSAMQGEFAGHAGCTAERVLVPFQKENGTGLSCTLNSTSQAVSWRMLTLLSSQNAVSTEKVYRAAWEAWPELTAFIICGPTGSDMKQQRQTAGTTSRVYRATVARTLSEEHCRQSKTLVCYTWMELDEAASTAWKMHRGS